MEAGISDELAKQLDHHEAGVVDLMKAYEIAAQPYFEAVNASTPLVEPLITSNSAIWASDANLG